MIVQDMIQKKFIWESPDTHAYVQYEIKGPRFIILHTIVPDALSGRGIAARLVEAAVNWAEGQGYEIGSVCSYADVWLKRRDMHRP
ncbi:MAG TPA: N-acetyltransferase [Veillonellaceae bacterium]|jgi:predicted GNAT family acetyltransferase|nr:N-acetyltransferase [Veillonellaceae bacterium]